MAAPETFEDMIDQVWAEARKVALQRQKKYGPKNIPEFGVQGVVVRLYDKMQRAIYRWWHGAPDQADETDEDTFIDIINYAIFCVCLMRGWWTNNSCPPMKEVKNAA